MLYYAMTLPVYQESLAATPFQKTLPASVGSFPTIVSTYQVKTQPIIRIKLCFQLQTSQRHLSKYHPIFNCDPVGNIIDAISTSFYFKLEK
jgi:hypothetical protein